MTWGLLAYTAPILAGACGICGLLRLADRVLARRRTDAAFWGIVAPLEAERTGEQRRRTR